MNYRKPEFTKTEGLPPVTTNFAPPPVQGGSDIDLYGQIEMWGNFRPDDPEFQKNLASFLEKWEPEFIPCTASMSTSAGPNRFDKYRKDVNTKIQEVFWSKSISQGRKPKSGKGI